MTSQRDRRRICMRAFLAATGATGLSLISAPGYADVTALSRTVTAMSGDDGRIIFNGSGPGQEYRYGPAYIINSDRSIDEWTCGDYNLQGDSIHYRRSTDNGLTWSTARRVMEPTANSGDRKSTCDPGVVRFGGYYYILYTGVSNDQGTNNNIFAARAVNPDGPWDKWNGNGWGGVPQPVIAYAGPFGDYGLGEPSAVVKDGTLFIYYSRLEGIQQETLVATAPANGSWVTGITQRGVAINREGVGAADGGSSSLIEDSTDIKYVDALGKFVGVAIVNRLSYPNSIVRVYESTDGLSFRRADYLGKPIAQYAHNIGMTGTETGHLDTSAINFIAFAYGRFGDRWNIERHQISLATLATGTLSAPLSNGLIPLTPDSGSWATSGGAVTQSNLQANPAMATIRDSIFENAEHGVTVRMTGSVAADDWVGVQIAKAKPSDYYFDSGYLVFLRANGKVSLYKAGQGVVAADVTSGTLPLNNDVRITVTKGGNTIRVLVGDTLTPQITWTDPGQVWQAGYSSLVTVRATAAFRDVNSFDNQVDDFSTGSIGWTALRGTWQAAGGQYQQSQSSADPADSAVSTLISGDGVYSVDMRITSSNTSSDWAGMQIAKTNRSDSFGQSGYLAFLRANGELNLYAANRGVVATIQTDANPVSDLVNLTIKKAQNNIQVFINRENDPRINWSDPSRSYDTGFFSLVDVNSTMLFDNFRFDAQGAKP